MLTFRSPAKVNLFLRILRRRDDGYHELASLFQAISLFDHLYIKLSDTLKLSTSIPGLPTDDTNLVSKAVRLFRHKTGLEVYPQIHLEKNIPMEAGLGGGSSNAATTLWALNELTGHPATTSELCAWGAEIGSDVAFFLSQGTAYCTGRGEILQSLDPLPSQSLWIIKPKVGLSTKEVYSRLHASSLTQRNPQRALEVFLAGKPDYFNDLEVAAFAALPLLSNLKNHLVQQGFSNVLMSGSGTSFFCMGDHATPSIDAASIFPVNFVNRSDNSWY